jgi:tetratricopeptide (TPR) repeat protein
MGVHLERGRLLLAQNRPELAESEFRQELAGDPEGPKAYVAHALLALCLADREQFAGADEEARAAVRKAPDEPLPHAALAEVLLRRNRLADAGAAAAEAVRLAPEDADHHELAGRVAYAERRWPTALEHAEQGLSLDPEHVGLNNLRAMALIQLGRRDEAGATLDAALARDPKNAYSHANRGWALLHAGDHRAAAECFREALRLEPGMEWARLGIIESLKARNPVYGLMLRWFLWMGRLSGVAQWGVVLGLFFGQRFLTDLSERRPEFAPFVTPLVVVLTAFALLTWLAEPVFNLLLRLDRFGRYALSDEEIAASNRVGACLVAAAALPVIGWAAGHTQAGLLGGLMFGMTALPTAATYSVPRGWPRWMMGAVAGGLALGATGAVALLWAGLAGGAALVQFVLLGCFLSQWLANGLMTVRVTR